MKARNNLKKLLDDQGITPYVFWQKTKMAQTTAYKLYNDPSYIPGKSVIEKIYAAFGWQPGEYIQVEPEADQNFNQPLVV